jgi:hypothetical protein
MIAVVLLFMCIASAAAFAPSSIGASMRAGALAMKIAVGDVAPDFSLTYKDGKMFKVGSDLSRAKALTAFVLSVWILAYNIITPP